MDGLEVLGHCHAADADLPVVLMTGHGDVETAVRAIREGAYDFIEKPFDRDRLVTTLQRAVGQSRLARENRGLRSQLAEGSGLADVLCGRSAAMHELRELILRLAPTPVDVLVCGETGTGKELVARALHDFSGRRGAFVPINCAALPEALIESELFGHESGAFTGAGRERVGQIEHAQHGTLFLDEIEAMPLPLQAKLLRVLQEREIVRLGSNKPIAVDVRIVAASNAPLAPLIEQGRFRADLRFRLDVVKLELPPLRDRREDIAGLFELFAQRAGLRFGVAAVQVPPGLADRLLAHDWPGNVRELRSAAERHVLGLPVLAAAGAESGSGRSLQGTLDVLEAMLIEAALARHKGRVDDACRELDVSPATFYRKLKVHGLQAKARRES
jgi:two-component system C4-dicarboxylate transport response regulator DctD